MFKTPEQSKEMLDLCFGDKEIAMCELFHAARVYSQVPTKFFVDVSHIIMKVDEKV